MEYTHSVSLDREKCKGCTNCLKRCPTEAIRIRDGHAQINSLHCIDCGECIRVCQYKAKRAVFDKLSDLPRDKYLIALPAPSLFGQFNALDDADFVIQGLLDMGFDDVYEVAQAAEIATELTRRYLKKQDVHLPAISSACPVVVRLIKLRFPTLTGNLIPILPPIEIAGKLARRKAMEEHPELSPSDIRTVFISPCPAKVSWVKNTIEGQEIYVDNVVSMSEVYMQLIAKMNREESPSAEAASSAGNIGISWAATGGESAGLMNDRYLAADGIENVIKVLDEIETGNINDLEFVELNACSGGCVGGVMAVENPYIARVRLQTLRRFLPISRNHVPLEEGQSEDYVPDELIDAAPFTYMPTGALGSDMISSMRLMMDAKRITEELPQIDCGSCGSPTCRAFAEDVVRGTASIDDCIVRMREKIQKLLKNENAEKGGS